MLVRLRTLVLFAIALLIAGSQCAAFCTVSCAAPVSHCHHRHAPEQGLKCSRDLQMAPRSMPAVLPQPVSQPPLRDALPVFAESYLAIAFVSPPGFTILRT
jgi:hypothetical protein